MNTEVKKFSVWWADVKLEKTINGEYYVSKDSFERPVVVIEQRAYMVFRVTSRKREGYVIKDLESAGVSEGSVIRTDVIVPVAASDLRYKMGELSMEDKLGLLDYMTDHPSRMMGKK